VPDHSVLRREVSTAAVREDDGAAVHRGEHRTELVSRRADLGAQHADLLDPERLDRQYPSTITDVPPAHTRA
jgi:hypothetical protein